MDGLLGFVKVQ